METPNPAEAPKEASNPAGIAWPCVCLLVVFFALPCLYADPVKITTSNLGAMKWGVKYTSNELTATGGSGTYLWSFEVPFFGVWGIADIDGEKYHNFGLALDGNRISGVPAIESLDPEYLTDEYFVKARINVKVVDAQDETNKEVKFFDVKISPKIDISFPPYDGYLQGYGGHVSSPWRPLTFYAFEGDGIYDWSETNTFTSSLTFPDGVQAGMPAGLKMSNDVIVDDIIGDFYVGILSGVPSEAGEWAVPFVVKDSSGARAIYFERVKIFSQLAMRDTMFFPDTVIGDPYPEVLCLPGGELNAGDVEWEAVNLPPGMTLNNNPDKITGKPEVSGPFPQKVTFTLIMTSQFAEDDPYSQDFSFWVTEPLEVTHDTGSLPDAIESEAYGPADVPTAFGGLAPYSWEVNVDTLPAGIELVTTEDGRQVLEGVPEEVFTTIDTYVVEFTAYDSSNPNALTASITLNLRVARPMVMLTGNLPLAIVGAPYNVEFIVAGGFAPYTWSFSDDIPVGLSYQFDESSGNWSLTGTPLPGTEGPYVVEIEVEDSSGVFYSLVEKRALIVAPASEGNTLRIETSSLPRAEEELPYTAPIQIVGGTQPYALTAQGLPSGLSIKQQEGSWLIAGTVSIGYASSDPYKIKLLAQDGAENLASQVLPLYVDPMEVPPIDENDSQGGFVPPAALVAGAAAACSMSRCGGWESIVPFIVLFVLGTRRGIKIYFSGK